LSGAGGALALDIIVADPAMDGGVVGAVGAFTSRTGKRDK
jgi:hypothetical protein